MLHESAAERLLVLLVEQLRSGELPQLLANDAWQVVSNLTGMNPNPALRRAFGRRVALDMDIFGIAVAQLQAVGRPADWVVSSPASL